MYIYELHVPKSFKCCPDVPAGGKNDKPYTGGCPYKAFSEVKNKLTILRFKRERQMGP